MKKLEIVGYTTVLHPEHGELEIEIRSDFEHGPIGHNQPIKYFKFFKDGLEIHNSLFTVIPWGQRVIEEKCRLIDAFPAVSSAELFAERVDEFVEVLTPGTKRPRWERGIWEQTRHSNGFEYVFRTNMLEKLALEKKIGTDGVVWYNALEHEYVRLESGRYWKHFFSYATYMEGSPHTEGWQRAEKMFPHKKLGFYFK